MSLKVGELFAVLTLKDNSFMKKMKSAEKNMLNTGRTMESIGRKATMFLTAPLAAAGGAALKLAMDAQETENLFKVSMGNMADKGMDFVNKLSEAYGLNRYELEKNLGTFNNMFDAMDIGEDAAYNMASGLTQLGNDMASFYNMKPEEAFLKLQAGITGEIEPLKRLGIVINETAVKTKALEMGLIDQGDEMTEQQKVAARYALIMEQTKNAQGDLARTMDSPTNQLRQFRGAMEEAAANLGTAFIPLMLDALGPLRTFADWLRQLDENQKKWVAGLVVAGIATGPVLIGVGKLTQAMSILKTAGLSNTKMVKTLGNKLKWLVTNPVGITITAAAAIAALAYHVYKNWDVYSDKFAATVEFMSNVVSVAGNSIKLAWNKTMAFLTNLLAATMEKIKPLTKILPQSWKDAFNATLENMNDYSKNFEIKAYQNSEAMKMSAEKVKESGEAMVGEWSTLVNELKKNNKEAGDSAKIDFEYPTSDALKNIMNGMNDLSNNADENSKNIGESLQSITDKYNVAIDSLTKKLELWALKNDVAAESTEYLAKKLEFQRQEHELLGQKIEVMTNRLKMMEIEFGAASVQVMEYKNKILEVQIEQEKLADKIKETNEELKKQRQNMGGSRNVSSPSTGKSLFYNPPVYDDETGELISEENHTMIEKTGVNTYKKIVYDKEGNVIEEKEYKKNTFGPDVELASGAVLKKTVFAAGEAGPEVVSPLSSLKGLIVSAFNTSRKDDSNNININVNVKANTADERRISDRIRRDLSIELKRRVVPG